MEPCAVAMISRGVGNDASSEADLSFKNPSSGFYEIVKRDTKFSRLFSSYINLKSRCAIARKLKTQKKRSG